MTAQEFETQFEAALEARDPAALANVIMRRVLSAKISVTSSFKAGPGFPSVTVVNDRYLTDRAAAAAKFILCSLNGSKPRYCIYQKLPTGESQLLSWHWSREIAEKKHRKLPGQRVVWFITPPKQTDCNTLMGNPAWFPLGESHA